MADKVIKSFTIGADSCTIDWTNGVANKPTIPADQSAAIAALQTAVAAITPKKVSVSWTDTNISAMSSYTYYQHSGVHSDVVEVTTGSSLMARDGDFGYPCIDGTGQVNLSPVLATGYETITPTVSDSTAYKNFKTPYCTCVDNLYRFTKVTKDFNVTEIAAGTEPTTGAPVVFKLVIPDGYTGTTPVVKQYRTKDAMLCNTTTTSVAAGYKPTTLTFTTSSETGTTCETLTYSKDTGYAVAGDGDTAQVNFTIDCTLVSGYTMSVVTNGTPYKNFNKPGYVDEDTGITFTNQYQITKVKNTVVAGSPLEITITIAAPVTVTYNQAHSPAEANDYSYSTDATEIPATVGLGSPLTFYFYHQVNKKNPTSDTTCCPDGTDCGGSGELPEGTDMTTGDHIRLTSITINGTAYTLTSEDTIEISGKKASVTIHGGAITGNVVVTLGSYSAS